MELLAKSMTPDQAASARDADQLPSSDVAAPAGQSTEDAFQNTLAEMGQLLETINAQGAEAFQASHYDEAAKLSTIASEITTIQGRMRALSSAATSASRQPMLHLGSRLNVLQFFEHVAHGNTFSPAVSTRGAFVTYGFALSALVCLLLGQILLTQLGVPRDLGEARYGIALHGAALVFLAYGIVCQRSAALPDVGPWDTGRTAPVAVIVGLAVFAALLRLPFLGSFPFRVDGDAAAFAEAASHFLTPDPPPLINTGWMGHTNLYFFFESVVLRIFGHTILAMRVFSALGGIAGVVAMFYFAQSLFGPRVAFFTAFTTAVMPFDLVFSRTGTEVIHLTWLVPLVMLALWEGWRRQSVGWLLLGGVVAGLSQYFYPGARLIPILCVAQLGLLTLAPPQGRRSIRLGFSALCWVTLGALIIYVPMLLYYARHPENFTARLNTVSIFTSGWMDQQLIEHPWWRVLGLQILRAFFPFFYPVGGAVMWYMWPQYLSAFDAALCIFGLVCVWFNRRVPLWFRLFLTFYLVVGFVLAGVVAIDSPMPSRYVIFVAPVALCIGLGIDQALRYIGFAAGSARQLVLRRVTLVGLLVYGTFSVFGYIQHDTEATWRFAQANQIATYAARYLERLGNQSYNIAYLSTSHDYYESNPALAFIAQRPGFNVPENATCQEMASNLLPGDNVVIAPMGRIDELANLHALLPEAEYQVYSDPKGEQLVGIMRVSAPPEGLFNRVCG